MLMSSNWHLSYEVMVIKLDKETIILDDVIVATSFFKRLIGLMGQKWITTGIIFLRCNSIHTFFMRENIDVVMITRSGKVIFLYENFAPWKLILPKKDVYTTIELPKDSIKKLRIKKGSYIVLP